MTLYISSSRIVLDPLREPRRLIQSALKGYLLDIRRNIPDEEAPREDDKTIIQTKVPYLTTKDMIWL